MLIRSLEVGNNQGWSIGFLVFVAEDLASIGMTDNKSKYTISYLSSNGVIGDEGSRITFTIMMTLGGFEIEYKKCLFIY